ncbi:uncharacterized protein LOC143911438 [Arctopsyche grandis]|uniref:uncharacterized protein LOC143911438 n=1 Tax=Arctopsyche grandis TaxID=121162 RepID=UPI00406D9B9D
MNQDRVCRVCLRVGVPGVALDEARRKRMLNIILSRPERNRVTRNAPNFINFPSWICSECDHRLPSAAAFIALCRRSERRLLCAQRLQIPFDTLHRQYKNKHNNAIQSIKRETSPFPVPSPSETDHWDNDSGMVYLGVPLPIEVKREDDIKEKIIVKKELKKEEDSEYTSISSKNTNKDKNSKSRFTKIADCKICGKTLFGTVAFKMHKRVHRGERVYKCSHCDVAFMKNSALTAHIERIHINPPPQKSYVCHLCGKIVKSSAYLKIHLNGHNTEMRHECEICKRRFRLRSSYCSHKWTHVTERTFLCSKCEMRFKTKRALKRHMTVHVEVCAFKCNICSKMLKSSYTLRQHKLNVHKNEGPHDCDVCSASLATKDNLKQHFRAIHSNAPGKCKICNKDVTNLREHKKSHASEMIFSCHLCSKRFSHKRSLTAHVKKHGSSDSSKFVCHVDDCIKEFSVQSLLDCHVTQHHNNYTPYVCQYCSTGFYTLHDMSKHIKNAHFKKFENIAECEQEMNT